MSRALPQPPLSSLPLPALMTHATFPESLTDRTPREWFDRAKHEADLAVIAERKGKREEVFVAYSRCCAAYANVKTHPDFKEAKKGDPHWTQRVKDFGETYEAYMAKAKEIKEALKLRDEKEPRPAISRGSSTGGPEVSSMGSIADRMKALKGKGLDVGSSRPPGHSGDKDKDKGPGPVSTSRNRAASNASASSSDKSRMKSSTAPKLPPHSLPTVSDGLPAPPSSSTPATGRSRSNSKAVPPPKSPIDSEPPILPKSPIHPLPPAPLPVPQSKLPPTPAPKPDTLGIPYCPKLPPAPTESELEDEGDFEKAFPSLSEFGKQFESEDFQPKANGLIGPFENVNGNEEKKEEEGEEVKFPEVPSFNLPSVPTAPPRSGLPPPPTRLEKLDVPSPTAGNGDKDRAVASPNGTSTKHDPPLSLRPNPPPSANGSGNSNGPSPQPSSSTSERPPLPPKPKFPLTNSIHPELLRSYIINPSVDMIVLDIRSEEDYQKSYVGKEYESKGYTTNVVWIDPTVLMRNDMTSVKLEDSLSLLPDQQRRFFENRHKADLVVVYDATSTAWPKDAQPLSRLWDIIYGNEFGKKLQRMPVLLVGGQEHWSEYVRRRQAAYTHVPDQSAVVPNGAPRRDEAKKANRSMGVYQPSSYKENYSSGYNYEQPSRSYLPSPPPTASSSKHGPSNSLSYPIPSIAPPPAAHPGPGNRRRSDYVEHSTQSYSGYTSPHAPSSSRHNGIDYPSPHALGSISKPPPVQSHGLERQGVVRSQSIRALDLMAKEEGEVRYWNEVALGMTGLKNLGNTCYMNSTLQCLSSTFPFSSYFLNGSFKKAINFSNPLGTKGNLASAFAELLKALWAEDYTFLSPVTFRRNIITFAQQFSGTDQHDSQEFLSFVLDGLHEDLNRVKVKPAPVEMTPEREARLETLPPEIASEQEWEIYRQRNDSFIVDLFQGQYRNRLECLTCHKTSTTYDTFMYMSLPVPAGRKAVVLQELIDEFVKAEIMEGEDAWHCPRCKVSRRASKTLTISRLPPVLLIQLKRFSTKNGVFWDKSETPVIFPIKSLDLSRYVPVRRATGREDLDDPRTQVGPFRYDLYGVSNHMGTLSSGHYTAFVKSSKGWQYCEDSKITPAQDKDVVTKPAYILFYKRVRA